MEKVKIVPAKLPSLVRDLKLTVIYKSTDYESVCISKSDANRPALQLAGFFNYFDAKRLQIMGLSEYEFLKLKSTEERRTIFDELFSYRFPVMVFSRNLEFFPEVLEMARKHDVSLVSSNLETVDATAIIIDYLNKSLAPQISRHGVLMNVGGQGVLILGDSGIGKSETAIELLKRGHRLISDDAVDIKRISNRLYGEAPEVIRHLVEIRGIGIIDIRKLFGMGSVQFDSEINLVIGLEPWQEGKFYDRLGIGDSTYNILGIDLPYYVVPVRPGRNLAGIIELATMKNRQTTYGDNTISLLDQNIDKLNGMF